MKMEKQYLVRQPATLQSMAIRNLAEWIASQEQKFVTPVLQLRRCHAPKSEYFISRQIGTIRNYVASKVPSMVTPPADIPLQGDAGKDEQVLSQQIEIIRNYLGKMPKKFHNMLLKEVIRAVTLIPRPGDVIGRMIETMFSENVTSLSLSYLSKNNIHRDLFYSKSYLLTGLTHLNLESHATEAQTIRFLKELHGLQYLTVTDVCTDNILKCLVDNCKLIDTLDLRRSNINNKSINKLIQLRQLKRVNLCNTAVSEKGIETLLKSCENIERIDTDVEVTEVLKHIVSKNAGKQFKLKSYFINSYGMTFEKMQFIVQTCPLLEDIYLTNLCEWRADYLTVLNYLHCLRDLTLMDYNFYEEHIYELLQVRGYNLLHLHLKYVRKTDGNDLMDIFEMCPNLQSLTINCNVEYLDDLDESNDSFTSEIEIPPLKDLTTLTLEDRKGYEFTDKQLVFLLSNCPNVVYLDVSKSYSVTDSIILQVLDRNPKQLMYLKELRIRDKLQKTLLLDRIIQHCESPLRIIEVMKMDKYLVQQPATLQSMAIKNFAKWIASQECKFVTPVLLRRRGRIREHFISRRIETIRNYVASKVPCLTGQVRDAARDDHVLSLQIETIRNYLGKMPKKFHNTLLKEVIRAVTLIPRPGDVIGRMIETMFSENVTSLSLYYLSKNNIHRDLFYSKSYLLTGLTHLNMESHATEAQTIRFLKELHGLKYLTVRCTDNILNCIVKNCKLIEKLDLSSSDINNSSINELIQLRHLVSVNLLGTAVCGKGIETLLTSCENMENIDTELEIGYVLEHIVSFNNNAGKQFKLKSYRGYETTLNKMQLIVKTCPLINNIHLTKLSDETSDCLRALHDLQHLRDLSLLGYDFIKDRIKELLQVRGHTLVRLHLQYAHQIDDGFKYVCLLCPNLQSLVLGSDEESLNLHDERYVLFPTNIEIPPLKKLMRLTLRDKYRMKFTEEQLIFLLSACPNVAFIETCSVTDSIISQVLDRNPKQLMNLKELRICDKALNTLSLDRIIRNCNTPPEIIVI